MTRSAIFGLALWFAKAAAFAQVSEPVDCVQMQGDLTPGGLVWARVAPGSRATVNGEALVVLADGTTLFGLGRDATSPIALTVEGPQACEREIAISPREYNVQRIEGVPQNTVTPPAELTERIARERALVGAAKGQNIERPDLWAAAKAGFSWPATGRISGVYGSQRIYNGTPRSPHYGIDIAIPTGTPVYAPAPGVVTLAEPDLFYSGGTVILDHGYRLSSSFLHLSKLHVAVGQELEAGELLGEVGASGRATGPHLDWRMSWRSHRVDPQLLVPPMPKP
ncbi:MAG: M23 family metallopeptidase [Pseudomonadota bacterium]